MVILLDLGKIMVWYEFLVLRAVARREQMEKLIVREELKRMMRWY